MQAWLRSHPPVGDDGELLACGDAIRCLLPARLPYDLLGGLLLAALDGRADVAALALRGIDVQQPLAAPLRTAVAAFDSLRRLALSDCNVDVPAAAGLAALCGGPGRALASLSLSGVFMCELAWQALALGLAAPGCRVEELQLQRLDVVDDGGDGGAAADEAWAAFIRSLAGCGQLRVLQIAHCSSLGPAAGAALGDLLAAEAGALEQLSLAGCRGIEEVCLGG